MKKTLLLALLVVAPACNLFLDRPERPEEPTVLKEKGNEALAQGQLGTALALYERVLEADPADPQAAVGSALTRTLLLPSAAPVNELFAACGQPPFDVERLVFGPDGLLAQDVLARPGSGDFTVRAAQMSQDFPEIQFAADHVRSFLERVEDGPRSASELAIEATDLRLGETQYPAFLRIRLDLEDVYGGGTTPVPLVDGLVVDVARLSGEFRFSSETRWLNAPSTGTLTFHGGKNVGDPFSVEFDVTGSGCVSNGDPQAACGQEFRITGTLEDSVSAPVGFPKEAVPFGTLEDVAGPPQVAWTIQAIERCGPELTTDLLARKAKALVPHLEAIIARLDLALTLNGGVTFTLPKTMLRTDEELVLGRTDLVALRGALHLAAAALELGSAYRYLDGPLLSLIETADTCVSERRVFNAATNSWETHPVISATRDFVARLVADNLAGTLLSRAAGFDLGAARAHLEAGLLDAADALRNPAARTPGFLDFQVRRAAAVSTHLAELADAFRQSMRSETPVTLPRNPLYQVHLKTFFDSPLDRERLLMLTGLSALARVVSGDPQAPACVDYNDGVDLLEPTTAAELQTWSGGAFFGPADLSTRTCGLAVACPEGYTCSDPTSGGVCDTGPTLNIAETPVGAAVLERYWPTFVLPGAQRLLFPWE